MNYVTVCSSQIVITRIWTYKYRSIKLYPVRYLLIFRKTLVLWLYMHSLHARLRLQGHAKKSTESMRIVGISIPIIPAIYVPTQYKPCLTREKYILRVKVCICYLLLKPTPCFPQSRSFLTAQFYVGVVLKVLLPSGLLGKLQTSHL
jgi:hypothetical protein